MPDIQIAARASDPSLLVPPDFSLSFWPLEGDRDEVEVSVHVKTNPSHERVASAALIHGIAVMALDQQGQIGEMAAEMFPNGLPSEAEAVALIELLMKEDANDQLV